MAEEKARNEEKEGEKFLAVQDEKAGEEKILVRGSQLSKTPVLDNWAPFMHVVGERIEESIVDMQVNAIDEKTLRSVQQALSNMKKHKELHGFLEELDSEEFEEDEKDETKQVLQVIKRCAELHGLRSNQDYDESEENEEDEEESDHSDDNGLTTCPMCHCIKEEKRFGPYACGYRVRELLRRIEASEKD